MSREDAMLRSESTKPKPASLPAITLPARLARRCPLGVTRPCAPERKRHGPTSTLVSRAIGPKLPPSCCSGKSPNPLARPSHEREPGTQPRDASDRGLLELRSRGRYVAVLYNRERPHSALGYETPAAFAAELDKQWPASLRPTGSAAQAIAQPALMRNKAAGL